MGACHDRVGVRSARIRTGHRLGVGAAAALLAAACTIVVPAAAATGVSITSGGCAGGGTLYCYNPEAASAAAGASVTWTNQSGAPHTATLCTASACPGAPASTGGNSFDVSIGGANGNAASFTFTSAGTYYYYCKIHGYAAMHGAITLTASAPSPKPSGSASSQPAGGTAGAGTGAPNTGASPGWLPLLLPIGALLTVLGLALRRRQASD
jgi:plastocyanin